MSLTKFSISLAVAGALAKANDLASVAAEINRTYRTAFTNGVTAGKADVAFMDTRPIAAAAFEDLDLAGGLADPFGGVLTFAKISAIVVSASAANNNDVVIGAAAANAFIGPFGAAAHKASVPPGGLAVFMAPKDGWVVTPATGDLLRVANGGAVTGVTYDIVLLGRSA